MILFSRKKPALSVLLATAFAIFASTASPVVVAQKNADQNASLLLGSISLNSDHKDADVMTDEDLTAIESITLDGTPVLAAEDTTKTDLLPPSSDDRSDRKEDPTALAAEDTTKTELSSSSSDDRVWIEGATATTNAGTTTAIESITIKGGAAAAVVAAAEPPPPPPPQQQQRQVKKVAKKDSKKNSPSTPVTITAPTPAPKNRPTPRPVLPPTPAPTTPAPSSSVKPTAISSLEPTATSSLAPSSSFTPTEDWECRDKPGFKDSEGDSCDAYNPNQDSYKVCDASNFKTDIFWAKDDCCTCQSGGIYRTPRPTKAPTAVPTITSAPSVTMNPTWVWNIDACQDTAGIEVDGNGKDCSAGYMVPSWHKSFKHAGFCGRYNTDTFDAGQMCCGCGGGSDTPPSSPSPGNNDAATTCTDTAGIEVDEDGDGCDMYDSYVGSGYCGQYNTDTFRSEEMCCACGGGHICYDTAGTDVDTDGDGCDVYGYYSSCGQHNTDTFEAGLMCCACGGGEEGTLPPTKAPSEAPSEPSTSAAMGQSDIVVVAEQEGSTTFVKALTAAGLIDILSLRNEEPKYTVLAPTNAAFRLLEQDLVDCLLLPRYVDVLRKILMYHMTNGEVFSDDIFDGQVVPTLIDENLVVNRKIDRYFGDIDSLYWWIGFAVINRDSMIISTDRKALNGVLHVIHRVLFPLDFNKEQFLETCSSEQVPTPSPVPSLAPTTEPTEPPTIVESLDIPGTGIPKTAQDEGFTMLIGLLDHIDWLEPLSNPDEVFTLFAPTDEAFESVDQALGECLMKPEGFEALKSILLYHVASGKFLEENLSNDQTIPMIDDGQSIVINIDDVDDDEDDFVMINENAQIVSPNLMASNGVLHKIDQVLLPANFDEESLLRTCQESEPMEQPTFVELLQAEEFASMRALLEDLELIEFLSNPNALFTMFAPTNEAFSLLEDVEETFFDCLKEHQPEVAISFLEYHFASGEVLAENLSNDQRIFMGAGRQSIVINIEDDESVMINENAQIVSPNLMASNGVLHKIDQVLFPANFDKESFYRTCEGEIDIASSLDSDFLEGDLGIFSWSIDHVGLSDRLATPNGRFTVFAPTNEAFELLGEELLECLAKPEGIPTLRKILDYHVANEEILAQQLYSYEDHSLTMSNDEDIVIDTVDVGLTVINDSSVDVPYNSALVVKPAQVASNGVLYIIDHVLIPESVDMAAVLKSCQEPSFRAFLELYKEEGFTKFVSLIEIAGFVEGLLVPFEDALTVYVPTNRAFELLGEELLSCLTKPEGIATLELVLLYHFTEMELEEGDFSNNQLSWDIPTLNGSNFVMEIENDSIVEYPQGIINENSVVVSFPNPDSNGGLVFGIDRVLIPSEIDVAVFLQDCAK